MSQSVTRIRDLSPQQVRSGFAAWLGWLFDGLDMHLYTLVATPFVAALLHTTTSDTNVSTKSSIIQAAFLVGWAFGGAFFGRVGDILGRRKALLFTILTYACFTGLSAFAQTWWQLMLCRFLAALGIGGEWAVGASLLVETWPKNWRPWMAAILQTAVNVGIMLACFAGFLLEGDESNRLIFLVGILPALLTLWIRKAVPETEEWKAAQGKNIKPPGIMELFGPKVRGVTWRVLLICAISLTAHWAFMFWQQRHMRALPEFAQATDAVKNNVAVQSLFWIMIGSVIGNFFCGALAKLFGYRHAIVTMFAAYAVSMFLCFNWEWSFQATLWWFALIGLCQGVFGLFTMCLPPLFPTLLRTTGAGFCYNFGRIVAAGGTVFFGLFSSVGDFRHALLYAGYLFIPAAFIGLMLPMEKEEEFVAATDREPV
ncbi:MFS transporter [soil metagenome]